MQVTVHRLKQGLKQGCQYRFVIHPRNRLVEADEIYSGSFQGILDKNLYRFYSACRQTILFTCRGGMGTYYELKHSNIRRISVHDDHSRTFDISGIYAQNFHHYYSK